MADIASRTFDITCNTPFYTHFNFHAGSALPVTPRLFNISTIVSLYCRNNPGDLYPLRSNGSRLPRPSQSLEILARMLRQYPPQPTPTQLDLPTTHCSHSSAKPTAANSIYNSHLGSNAATIPTATHNYSTGPDHNTLLPQLREADGGQLYI